MDREKQAIQPLAIGLTLGAALLRLAPHPPNFAPIGSVALFGGAKLRGWQAYCIPVLAMIVTDPLLSYVVGRPAYSWITPVIYGCFLLNVALGRLFLSKSASYLRVGSVALLGSVQFFLFTNFFEWLRPASFYPHTAAGLLACYVAAIPFFGFTAFGDLFYSSVFFGLYSLLERFGHRARIRSAAA